MYLPTAFLHRFCVHGVMRLDMLKLAVFDIMKWFCGIKIKGGINMTMKTGRKLIYQHL